MKTIHKKSKPNNKYGQYETDVVQFETVKEYMQFAQENDLVKEGEKPEAQVLRAINDYEGRRQLAKARPTGEGRGLGVRKVQKQITDAIKSGKVSKDAVEAALAKLVADQAAKS